MLQASGQHIAMMHYAGPPVVGGVESVMQHHADLFADAGYQVRIITGRAQAWRPDVEVRIVEKFDSLHPEVLSIKKILDTGQVPDTFATLVTTIAEELTEALSGIDVVIAHNICTMAKNLALTAALRQVCAQPNGPRLIAWHHDLAWKAERYQSELHEGHPWSLLLEPWNDTNITHVAVSEMRQQELATLQGIPSEDINVISSGVTLNNFYSLDAISSDIISSNKLDSHYPIFLLPVRITKRKNIEFALEIIAELRETFPNCALIVTGPPGAHNTDNVSYFSTLTTLRSELQLEPTETNDAAVYFLTEMVDERLPSSTISSLFRFCDALLIPSAEEGFGIPIIEAGLSGMPVFCSDIPPFREIAQTYATFFSLQNSAKIVATTIARHLHNDSCTALRHRVRSNYSWQAIFQDKIIPLTQTTKAINSLPRSGTNLETRNCNTATREHSHARMKEIN